MLNESRHRRPFEGETFNGLESQWIERVLDNEAFYDWRNYVIENDISYRLPSSEQLREVQFRDESLRDGYGTITRIPSLEEKEILIQKLANVGITQITLDIFSSVPPNGAEQLTVDHLSQNNKETLEIVEWMHEHLPNIRPVVLARSMKWDIDYLKLLKDKNPNLIGIVFQDISEVRAVVQGWGDSLNALDNLEKHIRLGVEAGIDVMAFTENLSITPPELVREYVHRSAKAGAKWIGIADTAGRLNPDEAAGIAHCVNGAIKEYKNITGDNREIGIVFHGHNDRGFAVSNSLAALSQIDVKNVGPAVIDLVINGLGERVGNTDMATLMGNVDMELRRIGESRFAYNFYKLHEELSDFYTRITGTQIGMQPAFVGDKRFSTSFGIHADYYYRVEKLAEQMSLYGYESDVINRFKAQAWKVYSADSPASHSREPLIIINRNSGASNVILRCKQLGLIKSVTELRKDSPLINCVLELAKKKTDDLSDEELINCYNAEFPENITVRS